MDQQSTMSHDDRKHQQSKCQYWLHCY